MTKKYVRVGFTSAQKTELWERWRSENALLKMSLLMNPTKNGGITASL